MASDDLDGDGDLDLLIERAPLQVLENDGKGRFQDVTSLPSNFRLKQYTIIDDLDGDEDPDILDPAGNKVFVNFEPQIHASNPPTRGTAFRLGVDLYFQAATLALPVACASVT